MGVTATTGRAVKVAMNRMTKLWKTLFRGLGGLSPSCKEAARLQSESLDRRLAFSQRLGLRIHLALCKWCRRYGKQITFLRSAAHDHPDELTEIVPQKLSAESRSRIIQKIRSNEE